MNFMHNFEAFFFFFLLELNDFKFKGQKKKKKSYKYLSNGKKSNQITLIDRTEPKKLEK